MSVGRNGINVVRNGRAAWEPNPCGTPHHNYPETLCTEPAGHYRPDCDPHAGPLIVDGREIGAAAWDEPKEICMADQTATQATDHQDRRDKEMEQLRRSIRSIMTANRRHVDRLTDEHQATIGELRRAEAQVQILEEVAAAREMGWYRDWLADQLSQAETRDRATGEVPPELRISPHNGMAAGLRTALLGLDRMVEAREPAPGVREVRVVVQAPSEENAGRWAETIRDLVVAEHGDSMRLEVTILPGGRA